MILSTGMGTYAQSDAGSHPSANKPVNYQYVFADEGSSVCTVTATVSSGTISCYGGLTSITVTANGGTAPYKYKGWINLQDI